MKRIILVMLIVIMSISLMAKFSRGKQNFTTGSDSLLGAADTVNAWFDTREYSNFLDKYCVPAVYYSIIGGDTASIAIKLFGYVDDVNTFNCTWGTFTDDSTYSFTPAGIDSFAWLTMYSDSILFQCISTAEASDSLAIELYLFWASFNQERP